jgi:hypothetical protein
MRAARRLQPKKRGDGFEVARFRLRQKRFPPKWLPVRRKKTRQIENHSGDSIRRNRIAL